MNHMVKILERKSSLLKIMFFGSVFVIEKYSNYLWICNIYSLAKYLFRWLYNWSSLLQCLFWWEHLRTLSAWQGDEIDFRLAIIFWVKHNWVEYPWALQIDSVLNEEAFQRFSASVWMINKNGNNIYLLKIHAKCFITLTVKYKHHLEHIIVNG